MRKIKFRAWDTINKRWINVFKLGLSVDGSVMSVIAIDGDAYGLHQVNLMQYTGLKDKNGKEIYEGDVIKPVDMYGKLGEWVGVVEFNMGAYWIYEIAGEPSNEESTWSGTIRCVVIGNIYENPELCES